VSKTRSRARQLALQALYQWQLTGGALEAIEQQFLQEHRDGRADLDYFHDLLHGVPRRLQEIDAGLESAMDRTVEEVDPVERAALRIGAYELLARPDVPYRVAINEAVELAKRFGAENGHRFVNGVLDKCAARLRPDEVARARAGGARG